MPTLRVQVRVDAPPAEVWRALADIASHVEWMRDAHAIRFTTPQRTGVGTAFVCDTRLGPFRLADRMEVTEWETRRSIGVVHSGLVTGTGRFTMRRLRWRRGTLVAWEERLRFPWWFGGPVGATVAKPILAAVWRRSLADLKARLEARQLSEARPPR